MGHPEFGDFKFGHTHPNYSNSGLDAVIAENYAAVNKLRGLTTDDAMNKQMNVDQLIRQITPGSGDRNAGEGVKIFTIAYGSDADVGALTRIANATGGQEYAGNPQNIRQVYQQISQFF